jgi:WD40 repeat protein
MATAAEIRTHEGPGKAISAIAYSRDGRRLAVAAGSAVSIRDAATGRELLSLLGYAHHVFHMAFSPDGLRLATAGGEDEQTRKGGGVKLWDLATGEEVLHLGGPTDIVTQVAFDRDGRRLVAARTVGGGFLKEIAPGFDQGAAELVVWDAAPPESRSDKD